MKHIHFIGICGVAMSALAIAFKKENWHVTGSDVGFYPPISTHLKDAGIDFYPGWHPNKMIAAGVPDLVVVGNVASSHNPEWLYVQEKKLNYQSYPEVIAKYFVKKNSIVVAGTFGKTTSTALVTWILREAGFDPSYMFGGLGLNGLESAGIADTSWSVLEGDEYKASRSDTGPKFAYYAPTHLLLTSVVWDHADVYQTEASYVEAFRKLVAMVPANGLRVISEKAIGVIPVKTGIYSKTGLTIDSRFRGNDKKNWGDNVVTYGHDAANDYVYTNCVQTKNGLTFDIIHEQKKYSMKSSCLGEYMADNITGCFTLAHQLGITPEKIITAVGMFRGMKRRLEKRYAAPPAGGVSVFDDIAHSPSKATAILETLKAVYKTHLIAVFEPNAGCRRPQAALWYDHAFAAADEVIIPRLTKIKVDENEAPPFEGEDIARLIGKTHKKVEYIDDDGALITTLKKRLHPRAVVVFLGSHGFRGMIETLITKLSS
ncbi:MAG: hypothetical protein HY983_03745 [Candidatus Magasanikbacteria bacterium]|nr:hypothetical protein [Candidatus Magasanikbacteria bacterium]